MSNAGALGYWGTRGPSRSVSVAKNNNALTDPRSPLWGRGQFPVSDPITNPAPWQQVKVGGVMTPGIVKVNGLEGFNLPSAWDEKRGKGALGDTPTYVGQRAAKGSITWLLWAPAHWAQWKQVLPLFKYNVTKGKTAQAIDVYFPPLAELGITSLYTREVGPIRFVAETGMWERTIWLAQYLPPPPVSAVSQPTGSVREYQPPPFVGGQKPPAPPTSEAQQLADFKAKLAAAQAALGGQ